MEFAGSKRCSGVLDWPLASLRAWQCHVSTGASRTLICVIQLVETITARTLNGASTCQGHPTQKPWTKRNHTAFFNPALGPSAPTAHDQEKSGIELEILATGNAKVGACFPAYFRAGAKGPCCFHEATGSSFSLQVASSPLPWRPTAMDYGIQHSFIGFAPEIGN